MDLQVLIFHEFLGSIGLSDRNCAIPLQTNSRNSGIRKVMLGSYKQEYITLLMAEIGFLEARDDRIFPDRKSFILPESLHRFRDELSWLEDFDLTHICTARFPWTCAFLVARIYLRESVAGSCCTPIRLKAPGLIQGLKKVLRMN